MRLLFDTHVAVWLLEEDQRLSARARRIIEDASGAYVSIVSVWEIATKRGLPTRRRGRPNASASEFAHEVVGAGIELLPLKLEHAFAVEYLPLHHGDPFDRLLVAQAIHEPMRLLTADAMLARYSDMVILV